MRWKEKDGPRNESIRTVRRFLFLPMNLGGEWRWLELAKIKQVYHVRINRWDADRWINMFWVNSTTLR